MTVMAKRKSGTAQGPGDQDGKTTQREGYTVYLGKEAWADELFATCRRLGLPPDRKGRPNLRKLAQRVGKAQYTLIERIGSAGDPDLETLRLLAQKAGLSVARSLLALGELTRADLEAELGVVAADLPPEVIAAWAGVTGAVPLLPVEPLASLFDAILHLRGLGRAGNSHGPSPTEEERS